MQSPHYFSNSDNKKPNAIINRKTTFLNEGVSEQNDFSESLAPN